MSKSASCKNNIDVSNKEMKAIGVLGSPREDGNTAYLLEEILSVLRKELKTMRSGHAKDAVSAKRVTNA